MLQAGQIVAQHLRLERQLGSGGMGSVWIAEHLRLGGQVAVKFLSMNLLDHAGARARFDKEAKWVAKIRSPHVVQVHDHGVTSAGEQEIPYIVMELLEGEDLATKLDRDGVMAVQQAAEILDQVADALTKAHEVGVVHRDVKPENVFLVSNKRTFVKLLDFGVAHGNEGQLDRLTQTGLLLGTAHYMSPEQLFSGKDIDYRADLWALGVLVYNMLTGRLPFHGETFGSLCLQVRDGHFSPPSQWSNIPPQLDAWFDKALALDRTQRFQSAGEMSATFQQAISNTAMQFADHPLSGATIAVSSAGAGASFGKASSPAYSGRITLESGRSVSESERMFGGTLSTEAQGALSLQTNPEIQGTRRRSTLFIAVAALAFGVGALGLFRVLSSPGEAAAVTSASAASPLPVPITPEVPAANAAASIERPGVASPTYQQVAASASPEQPSIVTETPPPVKAGASETAAIVHQKAAVSRAATVKPKAQSSFVEKPHAPSKPAASPVAPSKNRGF